MIGWHRVLDATKLTAAWTMPIRATVITWKTYSVVEWDSEVFVQEVKMPWERSLTGTFCRSLFTLYVLGAVEFPKLKLISLGTVFRRQSYTLWQTDWSTSGCCWRPEVKLTIEMKRITTLCSTYSSSRSDWVKRWSFCWYFWMRIPTVYVVTTLAFFSRVSIPTRDIAI